MSETYKACTANSAPDLDVSVQECLGLGYSLVGSISTSSVIDSSGVITTIYSQSVKKKNS